MLTETLRAVWEAFRANRGRFLLTLLGVVIGSASLVLLAGLLKGGEEALVSAMQRAAEGDLVEIRPSSPPRKDQRRTANRLDQGDVEALAGSPLLEDAQVVPQRQRWEELRFGDKRQDGMIIGARPDARDIYRLDLAQGRFVSDDDVRERRRVAVVGYKIWQKLLGAPSSLAGAELKTSRDRFQIVGVLARKPAFGGGDNPWQWDNRVIVPETTFNFVVPSSTGGTRLVERIFLRLHEAADLAERLPEVRSVAKATILRRHNGVENFRIAGEREEDSKMDLIVQIISLLILTTAIISLIVGGINVMNIMLVSVTERTREIGIRRAVGAPRRQILAQFLAESAATAGLGGLLGVAIGVGLTAAAAAILDRVVGGWTFHVALWAPPLALGAALLVGVLFGLFPAWKAARLDPVEALRFE